MYLNFTEIPGHQPLFLDYLYNFDKVAEFFGKNFRETEKFEEHFNAVLAKHKLKRNELHGLIKRQYVGIDACNMTRTNIELLRDPKTLAVITGQQLGIYGGPLYTFYKIITAIKLARQLKENHNDFNFVPVFWLEGDDHDFDEIRYIKVFAQNNNLASVNYDDGLPEETNRGSMGVKEFDNNIDLFTNQLHEILRPSDFKDELFAALKSAYFTGTTFKDAFFDLLFKFFDEYGLIIFDPGDKPVKEKLKDVFLHELKNYRSHADKLVLRSAELEDKYHAQVKIRPINLFMIENKERLAIDPADEGYRFKGKRSTITEEVLLQKINDRPDKVSANVILRPICQDYIFPTAFYIGGPGEISYFAQINSLYDSFGIEKPIIYPRSSATILEKNIKDILTKYGITIKDIYSNPEELSKQIIQMLSHKDINDIFEKSNQKLSGIIDELKNEISEIDQTLPDLSEKTKERILQNIESLRSKTESAQKRKFETALRQIEKAATMLYPEKNLQEREINFTYYANKYGIDFVTWMYTELSINKFEHQYLEI